MHKPGTKIVHRAQPTWGIGEVLGVREGGRYLAVRFAGRGEGPVLVSAKDPALARYHFSLGDEVALPGGVRGIVRTRECDDPDELARYEVEVADAELRWHLENELAARPPRAGALEQLALGRPLDEEAFSLRRRAVRLDLERRSDAVGALFGSRVMPKPHQVSVVQRVLSARAPRFVLADEVGLGKTIEAGMVYAALAQTGLARRVLIVTPQHLGVQWLAELFHKFHALFTFLDGARLSKEDEADPRPAWWRYDKVVTSLELLARSEEHREAIAAPEAAWDLVVFDEAHHLATPEAYAAAEAAADNTHGLLLLTATPLQLDPEEHFRLQLLVDPTAPETFSAFQARMERQGEISERTRKLLAAKKSDDAAEAAAEIAALLPDDDVLASTARAIGRGGQAGGAAKRQFLSHLAETYSLSSRLIRNRRALVGGLSPRKLVRHDVTLSETEREFREALREAAKGGALHVPGGSVGMLLKRSESSPRAAAAVLVAAKHQELAERARTLEGASRDAKAAALVELVKKVREEEPGAKLLVFTEVRETLEYVRELLGRAGVAAAIYHGELTQLDRDRQVARFRDPEGPEVLISTEVGGEGRNFQFCHHLVNYDLAWSPAAIEQRIGRLDRIGQQSEVFVHCFRVEGTHSAHVFDLMADAVRVFDDTVGGLDPVLEIVEHDLARLLVQDDEKAFTRYQKVLATRVAEAREEVKRAYDPLLDLRSYDEAAVRSLLERAASRLELPLGDDEPLEEALSRVARDLDERLEETVCELARRVGIHVDTDEQVEAFQAAFHLGGDLKVDALPGLELGDRVLLGTFWRDTAVVQEENEYFATGHPLVESLFGWIRDGELGRAAWIESDEIRPGALGFAFTFLVTFAEPEDLAAGSRVPSRQASRYLETQRIAVAVEVARGGGTAHVRDSLLSVVEEDEPDEGRPPALAREALSAMIATAHAAARAEAEARLKKCVQKAEERLASERDAALARLSLSGKRADEDEVRLLDAERESVEEFHDICVSALRATRLELDQAAGIVSE